MYRTLKRSVARLLGSIGLRVERIQRPNEGLPLPRWAQDLRFPTDHALPAILRRHPDYQENLAAIVAIVSEKYPDGVIVDVGANVGDTASLIRTVSGHPIICIEGDAYFQNFLGLNTNRMADVHIVKAYVGERCGSAQYQVVRNSGTMQLIRNNGEPIPIITLDSLMVSHRVLARTRLLKIDADGFDVKILRGAETLIEKTKPVLFFEYDPTFLRQHDPYANETIEALFNNGYEGLIIYDHLGRRLLAQDNHQSDTISQVGDYLLDKRGLLPYVDLCITSRYDHDIFTNLRSCCINDSASESATSSQAHIHASL